MKVQWICWSYLQLTGLAISVNYKQQYIGLLDKFLIQGKV
jgi:hypothetical protein